MCLDEDITNFCVKQVCCLLLLNDDYLSSTSVIYTQVYRQILIVIKRRIYIEL